MKFLSIALLIVSAFFAFAYAAPPGVDCDQTCTFQYDPVCAQIDGLVETFGTQCAAEVESCRRKARGEIH